MIPEPLHPAVVHFPIVLMLLLPLVALASVILIRRGFDARKAWAPVVLLAAAVSASGWVATETGEAEEEVVEDFVPEAALHEHEEAAERFLVGSLVTLVIVGTGLLGGRPGRVGRMAGTLSAVVLTFAGYQVGRLGGELVYEDGAASAYLDSGSASPLDRDDDRELR